MQSIRPPSNDACERDPFGGSCCRGSDAQGGSIQGGSIPCAPSCGGCDAQGGTIQDELRQMEADDAQRRSAAAKRRQQALQRQVRGSKPTLCSWAPSGIQSRSLRSLFGSRAWQSLFI
jgi:hypothetical protein